MEIQTKELKVVYDIGDEILLEIFDTNQESEPAKLTIITVDDNSNTRDSIIIPFNDTDEIRTFAKHIIECVDDFTIKWLKL